jgi:hypothetical protein
MYIIKTHHSDLPPFDFAAFYKFYIFSVLYTYYGVSHFIKGLNIKFILRMLNQFIPLIDDKMKIDDDCIINHNWSDTCRAFGLWSENKENDDNMNNDEISDLKVLESEIKMFQYEFLLNFMSMPNNKMRLEFV